MTGYGRGETDHNGTKFSVELNSVNRKQSDIVINLPRDLAALEPQIRQTINENISRGRTNVVVSYHNGSSGPRKLALDTELARSYHDAMRALQKDLDAPGEITIGSILQAPGVMRAPEETIDSSAAERELAWSPGWTLEQGLEALVHWHEALRGGDDMRAVSMTQIHRFAAAIA